MRQRFRMRRFSVDFPMGFHLSKRKVLFMCRPLKSQM